MIPYGASRLLIWNRLFSQAIIFEKNPVNGVINELQKPTSSGTQVSATGAVVQPLPVYPSKQEYVHEPPLGEYTHD